MAEYDGITLPKGLSLRNGRWYVKLYHNGRSFSRALKCTSIHVALRRYEEFERDVFLNHRRARTTGEFQRFSDGHASMFARMLAVSKSRAVKKGIPHTLTRRDIQRLFLECDGVCAVSGIPFTLDRPATRAPFSPSLDRIDCTKGYTYQNCRIVCYLVNLAMSDYGDGPLMAVANAIVAKQCEQEARLRVIRCGDGLGTVLGNRRVEMVSKGA